MKFDVLTDPGHGWIKVPKKLLAELGIANKITPYSYMRGDFAYLEEDADASTFFEAMRAAGKTIEQRVRLCLVVLFPERHRPHADRRHLQGAIPQRAILHCRSLLRRKARRRRRTAVSLPFHP